MSQQPGERDDYEPDHTDDQLDEPETGIDEEREADEAAADTEVVVPDEEREVGELDGPGLED